MADHEVIATASAYAQVGREYSELESGWRSWDRLRRAVDDAAVRAATEWVRTATTPSGARWMPLRESHGGA